MPAPKTGAAYNDLRGIVAVSPNDVWAVGSASGSVYSDARPQTIIMHWDGSRWSIVPSPNPGKGYNQLWAVAAISKDDIWAVGSYGDDAGSKTLTVHWDGTRWTHVPIPGLGNIGMLQGVSGVSPDDVWAVGSYYSPTSRREQTLVLHWDGVKWSPPSVYPDPERGQSVFRDVSAFSPNDAWAVGYTDASSDALIAHWDGKVWSQVPSPDAGGNNESLFDVEAIGPGEVWAVGSSEKSGALVMRWDGISWQLTPSPNTGGYASALYSMAYRTANDIWAIGIINEGRLLAVHWNGSGWEVILEPVLTKEARFARVTALGGDVWIGGSYFEERTEFRESLLVRRQPGPCPAPTSAPALAKPLDPPFPLSSEGMTIIPATGKSLGGPFLRYWLNNGDVAQQGYPISDVMGEISELDGKPYTVQYFERALFEYHPDNRPPYDVLLAQLGTFQYKKRYPSGAPDQQPNNSPGSVVFSQTGKRLGGAFLEYWRAHGSLAQQGYPIADEFEERNQLDGKVYRVQYFERAQFEYHPENSPPNDVLLSHLGKFRYDAKYSPQAAPAPVPRLIAQKISRFSTVANNQLFWLDSNRAVQGYDPQTDKVFKVIDELALRSSLTSDGKRLAWLESKEERSYIKVYDIIARKEYTYTGLLTQLPRGEEEIALSGDTLFYVGALNSKSGIIAHNLPTGTEELIIEEGRGPTISNDRLVWVKGVAQCYPGNSHPPCVFHAELYWRKVGDTLDNLVVKAFGQYSLQETKAYGVSGSNFAWIDETPRLYNIQTGAHTSLSTLRVGYPTIRPVIGGDIAAWADANNDSALKVYRISTGELTKFSTSLQMVQPRAIVGPDMIAFTSGTSYNTVGDLYVIDLGSGK